MERLHFEELLSNLSARFVNLPVAAVDQAIEDGLRQIVEFLGVDRSTLFEFSADHSQLRAIHSYALPGFEPVPQAIMNEQFPWYTSTLSQGEIICISRLPDDLPAAAVTERQYCQAMGFKSNLSLPIQVGGAVVCALAVGTLRAELVWPPELIPRLRLLGEVFANALVRKCSEEQLQLLQAAVESANDSVVIAARTPDLPIVWASRSFATLSGYPPEEIIGRNCRFLQGPASDPQVVAAIREALANDRPFQGEILNYRKDGTSFWNLLRIAPVRNRAGEITHFVGIQIDITERKQTELQLQTAFTEIAQLKNRLEAENLYLREEIKVIQHGEIVGQSAAIQAVLRQVEQVAGTHATVLLLGETGTGKELLARAIHHLSARQDRPLVKVNCAALPPTLIEAELFGREKGAYTGALTRQPGRFELADGSTLLLDEIGELPLEVQGKLLQVLQTGEFERLGSTQTRHVNVRVIAATNQDLAQAIKARRFREDLYYRLNVFPIAVPPLRERLEDIPLLVWTFVREFSKATGKTIERLSKKSLAALPAYPWPGNIRELRNLVERAMILCQGPTLHIDLPLGVEAATAQEELTLAAVERRHILAMLTRTGWRIRGKQGAADLLGLKPTTLYSRMEKLGIQRKPER